MSVDFVKQFDIWFGGIFFSIGLVALLAGAVVCVYFARKPPRKRGTWILVFLPLGLGLVFALLGGIFAVNGLNALQREERLRATGVTTRGTVVEVERTSTRLNGSYLWQVRYSYRDPAGRAYQGVSGYLERAEAQSFRVGEAVFVRYDPAEPSSSIWLGREETASAPGILVGDGITILETIICYRPL